MIVTDVKFGLRVSGVRELARKLFFDMAILKHNIFATRKFFFLKFDYRVSNIVNVCYIHQVNLHGNFVKKNIKKNTYMAIAFVVLKPSRDKIISLILLFSN